MATEGIMIDITKPENYMTRSGDKIFFIGRNLSASKYSDCALFVVIKEKDGDFTSSEYFEDGFHHKHAESEMDLILRPASQEQEQKNETKKRKIIQLAVQDGLTLALCDDGEVFSWYRLSREWVKWDVSIPQD